MGVMQGKTSRGKREESERESERRGKSDKEFDRAEKDIDRRRQQNGGSGVPLVEAAS